MKENIRFFISVVLLGFIVFFSGACESSPNPDDYILKKGGLDITSYPAKAQIWLNGLNSYKVTRDSIINLDPGTYKVTLVSPGYFDSTFQVTVSLGIAKHLEIDLSDSKIYDTIPASSIYKTDLVSETKNSGIVLSAGVAFTMSGPDSVDFFYSSYDSTLRSPDAATTELRTYSRKSRFLKTTLHDVADGAPVPKAYSEADPDWTDFIPDTLTSYFFVYDFDQHYSKVKISKKFPTSGSDPSWLEVIGYYNMRKDNLLFK